MNLIQILIHNLKHGYVHYVKDYVLVLDVLEMTQFIN